MKRNPNFVLHIFMAVGDVLSLVGAFVLAYVARVTFGTGTFLPIPAWSFLLSIVALMPIWIAVFYFFGLYDRVVYKDRVKELGRLFLASVTSIAFMIGFSYFMDYEIFPAKLVPLYALVFVFVASFLSRTVIRKIKDVLLSRGVGILKTIIVGNSASTMSIIDEIRAGRSDYRIVGIVANNVLIPKSMLKFKFSSLTHALAKTNASVIIQTDETNLQKNYQASINKHMRFVLVPNQELVLSSNSNMELLGTLPIIQIKATPLIGYGKFVKRLCDLVFGVIIAVVSSPFLLVLILINKISDPKGKVFFKQKRLSIYGKKVDIFKLRSIKSEYNNMSPEEAFAKMGRPELGQKYRANGDQLDNDPRVTRLGKFMRATSLDELPQIFNVLSGDISLVGPRALVPGELSKYSNKNLILSVKSGLTGLAQVSGRRDISFEERRSLDVYYVQNWSFWLDLQIMFKSIWRVILRRGAK